MGPTDVMSACMVHVAVYFSALTQLAWIWFVVETKDIWSVKSLCYLEVLFQNNSRKKLRDTS